MGGEASTYLDRMEEKKKTYTMQKCRECKKNLPIYCYIVKNNIISQICEECEKNNEQKEK